MTGFARHLALAVLSFLCAGGVALAAPSVGFQRFSIPDGAGPRIEVGVWYPSDAPASPQPLELFTQTVAPDGPVAGRRLPLVVMSHGQGGSFGGHYDTALALARAGFVAAALTHTGDNYKDHSRATDMANRPRQLHSLIASMLNDWAQHARLDPDRVGAFGFSSGGFTVLVAAGGVPDFNLIRPFCAKHSDLDDCRLVASMPHLLDSAAPMTWVHDPRVKAVVAAAPALGFTFTPAGLRNVVVPVDLWRPQDDRHLPDPFYAETVRRALPKPPRYHVVPHAGHYDFLAPCNEALAREGPTICTSEPGFDRTAFHKTFDNAVVKFFRATLKPRPQP